MKKSLLSLSLLALSFGYSELQAQTTLDYVHKVSSDRTTGTARFKAMGGVNTALGGDISSINGNPAGLGFYGQSDVAVTVNYLNNTNKASYFNQSTSHTQGKFGLENVGVVLHFPSYNNGYGWQNLNLGVSYDRTDNFTDRIVYSGINAENTLVQYLSDQMFSSSAFTNDFRNSNLVEIFPDPSDGYYPTAVEIGDKAQQVEFLTKGYKAKTTFSVGGNYNNKFYIGGSLGLVNFKYNRNFHILESGWTKTPNQIAEDNPNSEFADPTNPKYKYTDINYDLTDYQDNSLRGTGVNVGVGVIFKPTWDWNIGINIVTPTWTTVNEEEELETIADYYKDEYATTSLHPTYRSKVSSSSFDYGVISPMKASVGLTKFFSRGLLSADIELVDYSTIRYEETNVNNPDYQFEDDMNRYDIPETYKAAFNFRVGGEFLFTDYFTGRAGFSYFSSPYKNSNEGDYMSSIGLGYILTKNLYVDLAAVQYKSLTSYSSPYSLSGAWNSPAPEATIKNNRTNIVFTLGAKF